MRRRIESIGDGQPSRLASRRIGTLDLRAYPKAPGPEIPIEVMTNELFAPTLDARSESRRRFGRTISMDVIEIALRQAYRGTMRSLTDILRETVETDPHLGSILNKRFGSVSALPWELQPAEGQGIDREKAMFYAEVCRQQLRNMKSFRNNLKQLAWSLFDGRGCLEHKWVQVAPGLGATSDQFGTVVLAIQGMEWIHPRRLSFGPERELRIQPESVLNTGNFSPTGIDIRDWPDKFIWWTPQLFGEYPEREGLGIRCMYWSFFKRFAARERMILTELFGKPWRIITVEEESSAGADELTSADESVDALGSSYTVRLPRGVKLDVVAPGSNAGQVHQEVITESDKQNSKLVLGQTGTTDAVPAGLNSNQANVMQDEQLGVLIHDARLLSEVIETLLTDRIIALNFGELEVTHAPTFLLRADLPADRIAELDRLKGALEAGLPVTRAEAYEVSGFQVPQEGEVVVRMEQPPTPPNSPVAPAVRATIVYPQGSSPDVGEQQPPAAEAAPEAAALNEGSSAGAAAASTTVTVNEDRASRGLEPLTTPEGALDPRGDLTIKEFDESFAVAAAEKESEAGDQEVEVEAPVVEEVVEAEPEPAKQAMNGGQIASVLDMLTRYTTAEFPRETVQELLIAIFPFTEQQVNNMLDPIVPVKAASAPAPAPAPAPGAPPPPSSPDEDEPDEDEPDEDEPDEDEVAEAESTALGLSRLPNTFASNVAEEIANGEMLYGEAGIHAHQVLRATQSTVMDGAHSHVFRLPMGVVVTTELDGVHQHGLANVDANVTVYDGKHMHALILGGEVIFTLDDSSAHQHELQVDATAVDGLHQHSIEVNDSDNPGNKITIFSMTAGEFAESMREGVMPGYVSDQLPGTSVAKKRRKVYGAARLNRELRLASKQHTQEMKEWSDWLARGNHTCVQLAVGQSQPETPNGSVEDYVVAGMVELTGQTAVWADTFGAAVEGETTAAGIFLALNKSALTTPIDMFGRALERRKLQALMLGTLDSAREISGVDPDAGEETIEDVVEQSNELGDTVGQVQDEVSEQLEQLLQRQHQTITASVVRLAAFTEMPFEEAVKFFAGLNVLDKATFERAQIAIRQRSFTVAGILRDQMLRTLQDELAISIRAGDDLRNFTKRMTARLKQSGFLAQIGVLKDGTKALNAAHVETVFRTNVLNTYNTGRFIHQTSPAVLAAFPVWEFRGLPPTDPQDRKTHFAVNGVMLLASDPFWINAYAPYGFNCRCRVVARQRKFMSQVVPGSTIQGLPDPGFSSGRPALAVG